MAPEQTSSMQAWRDYGRALAWVAVGVGLQFLLMPILEGHAPHVTIYPAVMLAAVVGGVGPGILAAVIGHAVGDFQFGEPRYQIHWTGQSMLALAALAGCAAYLGHVGNRLRSARQRAEEEAAATHTAEERFRLLAEASPDVIFRVRLVEPLGFEYVSPSILRMTGYTAEEHYGDPLIGRKLVHEEDQAILMNAHEDPDSVPNPLCLRFVRRDGQVIWTEHHNVMIRDENGRPVAVQGIVRDVTEQRRAEEALRAAKLAAEEASQSKDRFLAVLSHELRTPLTPVAAAAAMLADDERLPEDAREDLRMIQRNVELETRLIDDLLDLTRIVRDKLVLETRPVSLGWVIEQAMRVCMADVKAKGLELAMWGQNPPTVVRGDAGRLQQVFWNLLKNAIKFTPAGGRVGVRWYWGSDEATKRRSDEGEEEARHEGGRVVVEISDSGIGIGGEQMGRLFAAFEQGDRSVTQQFGGLGLGLAISKAIVERHGGTIRAHSEGKGKGATFWVELPLCEEAAMPEMVKAGDGQAKAQEGAALRILLVEDHEDTAKMLGRLLEGSGHRVWMAGDVRSAMGVAGREAVDLVVSDLGLPDGSGLELMKLLREGRPALPGIALSGYGMDKDLRESREAGFAEHLVKPVNLQALEAAIGRVVGKT